MNDGTDEANGMTLVEVRDGLMNRGWYPVFADPKDVPGKPAAWIMPDLRRVSFAHPGGQAIPLYSRRQAESFTTDEWPLPHPPGEPLKWYLLASTRRGVRNERGVPCVREVILGVPFDVPHPGREYTPLYAPRGRTKWSARERFWDWVGGKKIEGPRRIALTLVVFNLALASAAFAYQWVTERRVDWGDLAEVIAVVTLFEATLLWFFF